MCVSLVIVRVHAVSDKCANPSLGLRLFTLDFARRGKPVTHFGGKSFRGTVLRRCTCVVRCLLALHRVLCRSNSAFALANDESSLSERLTPSCSCVRCHRLVGCASTCRVMTGIEALSHICARCFVVNTAQVLLRSHVSATTGYPQAAYPQFLMM